MHPHLFPTITLSLMIITITLIHCPTSLCAEDEQYNSCSTPISCGAMYFSYPFWGSNRPDYCGHPNFEINCSNNVPLIKITYMNYRVLEINNSSRTLTVARTDYLDTICPPTIVSTSIDFNLFSYTSSTNLTLYYDCTRTPPIPIPELTITYGQFYCSINNTNSTGYYDKDTRNTPTSTISSIGVCGYSVDVPILQSAGPTYTTEATVTAAIDGGFMLEWNANNPQCDECVGAGGLCGSDPTTKAFACHCASGTFASGCSGITGKYPCHFSFFILAILQ